MKTFPKPLSPAEETMYLQKWTDGDLEARNILIERNLRLVAHIVKKYQSPELDPQDLLSIGTIGLIKAVQSFDSNKGKLGTYAAKCIENELLMLLRSKKKTGKEISLYEPIGNDYEGNEIVLLDIIEADCPDMTDSFIIKENIKLLYSYAKEILSHREWEIIQMRYGLGMEKEYTQREIANKLQISRSYVSRIEKKALQKLQECFLKASNLEASSTNKFT